jgi:hypothetical protein
MPELETFNLIVRRNKMTRDHAQEQPQPSRSRRLVQKNTFLSEMTSLQKTGRASRKRDPSLGRKRQLRGGERVNLSLGHSMGWGAKAAQEKAPLGKAEKPASSIELLNSVAALAGEAS